MFSGRQLVIATQHDKEKVIAPILEKELGVQCLIPSGFNTDLLGTFTGEIERNLDPLSTAREKCLRAMEVTGCDLGVASEGSFGPHPEMVFAPADGELLIFIDKKQNLEIVARKLSTVTNFSGQQVRNEQELMDFARKAQFPSHALILRPGKNAATDIVKGIVNEADLRAAYDTLFARYWSVFVETDMRAMYNPMRMQVIEQATQLLAAKMVSLCPKCRTPGFSVTDAKQGLPFGLCGMPTRSTLSYIYVCKHCRHEKEEQFPHGKTTEDPTYCDYCNP